MSDSLEKVFWKMALLRICIGAACLAVLMLSWGSWSFSRMFNYKYRYQALIHEQIERETAPLKARIEALEKRSK